MGRNALAACRPYFYLVVLVVLANHKAYISFTYSLIRSPLKKFAAMYAIAFSLATCAIIQAQLSYSSLLHSIFAFCTTFVASLIFLYIVDCSPMVWLRLLGRVVEKTCQNGLGSTFRHWVELSCLPSDRLSRGHSSEGVSNCLILFFEALSKQKERSHGVSYVFEISSTCIANNRASSSECRKFILSKSN